MGKTEIKNQDYGNRIKYIKGFPGGSVVKNPPGDSGSIHGSGRSLGEGNGNPL